MTLELKKKIDITNSVLVQYGILMKLQKLKYIFLKFRPID